MARKKSISPGGSIKRLPQRTCLACRQVRAKRDLVRLVRTTEGQVVVDPSGKKAGRGAYICRIKDCWEAGLKGNRLEHALRTKLSQDDREQLMRASQGVG